MYNVLPSEFKERNEKRKEAAIKDINSRIKVLQEKIRELQWSYPKKIKWYRLFVAVAEIEDGGGIPLFIFFFPVIIALAILDNIFVAPINRAVNKKKDAKLALEINAVCRSISKCEDELIKITEKIDRETQEYLIGFEQEAQKMSINYVNSAVAKEVIDWLSDEFLKLITASNRASNIEKVVVPFEFLVYDNEIRGWNFHGKYNFDEHRCEKLPDVLAQAALARAIASQIQLRVMMQHDKDLSGTRYQIEFFYSYPNVNYINTNIVYTAPNGNYKPVQKW